MTVRRLPDGLVQHLPPSFWNWAKRADIDEATTLRIANFVADALGEYELISLCPTWFHLGDWLRILPSTAEETLPLLLFLVSRMAPVGGFIIGIIAAFQSLERCRDAYLRLYSVEAIP